MGLKLIDTDQHWVDGLVPFEINDTDFPVGSANRTTVENAIAHVNENTHVNLVPKVASDISWINFIDHPTDGRCGGNTGRADGENQIRCDLDGGFTMGNLVHEILHELGIHHEQLREDRDSFVTVQWSKITDGDCDQFQRKIEGDRLEMCSEGYDPSIHTLITEDVGAYDYGSIMHYGRTFFRKPGETGDTLSPTNPATATIGQRTALSTGDITTLNDMYSTDAIYVRDNLTDDGQEPLAGGGLSRSPDIIHVVDEITDPQATLSTPASMASDSLSETVEEGQTNFVYVRLQKNGVLTDDAEVDLYWADPSTLPTPSVWLANKIDDTKTATVAPGEIKIVGPFLFTDVPTTGHYCFVAIVHSRKNPRPELSASTTSLDFVNLVRNKSNVAWKNFDVEDNVPGGESDMDFAVNSFKKTSSDNVIEFDLRELPQAVSAQVRILKRLAGSATLSNLKLDRETKLYAYYNVGKTNRIASLKNVTLKSRENTTVRLHLEFPETIKDGVYDIDVKQLKGKTEFGRVTRRINIGDFPFIGNIQSMELHTANCPWVPKMSHRNKRPYRNLQTGLRQGYDGCHTCLLEHDHG